jgi:uncharacterized protein (DUF169 family)
LCKSPFSVFIKFHLHKISYTLKKFGKLSKIKETQIFSLPIEKVEELAESLFDFRDETEVENWLKKFAK